MIELIENIKYRLKELKLSHFLTAHPVHLRYLCGFTGSTGLCLIAEDHQYFITDGRYQEQAQKEILGYELFFAENSRLLYPTILNAGLLPPGCRVGFEADYVTISLHEYLVNTFPQAIWIPARQIVEPLRIIKRAEELDAIKKAVRITENVFQEILRHIRPGITESEIAALIAYLLRLKGGQKEAFDVIVASGARTALPHAKPTGKVVEPGDTVILDFGAVYNGYHADMTRTVFMGNPSEQQKNLYHRVNDALQKASSLAVPGIIAADLDDHVRKYFNDHGMGTHFLHALGHGIGLEIHEAPLIGAAHSGTLTPGMVFTLEPGLYLPGAFGVRIENDYYLSASGAVNLMSLPESMIILPVS